jgi:hypothetical protein
VTVEDGITVGVRVGVEAGGVGLAVNVAVGATGMKGVAVAVGDGVGVFGLHAVIKTSKRTKDQRLNICTSLV